MSQADRKARRPLPDATSVRRLSPGVSIVPPRAAPQTPSSRRPLHALSSSAASGPQESPARLSPNAGTAADDGRLLRLLSLVTYTERVVIDHATRLGAEEPGFDWPDLDERDVAAMCAQEADMVHDEIVIVRPWTVVRTDMT